MLYGQVRQGDVFLLPVESLPEGAVLRPAQGPFYMLAEGSSTGNSHRLPSESVEEYEVGANRYYKVLKPEMVFHQEHPSAPLAVGIYKLIRQRQLVPEGVRPVQD